MEAEDGAGVGVVGRGAVGGGRNELGEGAAGVIGQFGEESLRLGLGEGAHGEFGVCQYATEKRRRFASDSQKLRYSQLAREKKF